MTSLRKSTVLKVYLEVIEDVINGVKDLFLEDGVDEQILMELKQTWETKLRATKAVENQSDVEKQGLKKLNDVNGFPKQNSQVVIRVVGQVPPNNHVQTQVVPQILDAKFVPIQINLPAQPGTNMAPRVLTIQVPAKALLGYQLHKVLTDPFITEAMSLPLPLASAIIQNYVYEALSQQQQVVRQITKPVIQSHGMHMPDSIDDEQKPSTSKANDHIGRPQLEGPMDTLDEEDDDDASDDDKDEDEQEVDEAGSEEESDNSEDDVTYVDLADLFDTDNVVVCQYDKITRSRNKWKFHLKDGIMNLNGEDSLFQKASGDAEW